MSVHGGVVEQRGKLRAALERLSKEPGNPAWRREVKALTRDLPAGAWTHALWSDVGAALAQDPQLACGTAMFPAVAPDGTLEVRVHVSRTASSVDDVRAPHSGAAGASGPAENAVKDALIAVRAYLGLAGGFQVRFTPDRGWEGGSCGLAVALAAVSAARDRPLRACVWATGVVAPDGGLKPVAALWEKRSNDRHLLEPLDGCSGAPCSIAVGTLAAAVDHAFGAGTPILRAAALNAATDTWLRTVGWSAAAHVPTVIDDALDRWWERGGAGLVVEGPAGAGSTWRLAALVHRLRGDTPVLALAAPHDDSPDALAAQLCALLVAGSAPMALSGALEHLVELGTALHGQPGALLVIDDPGPNTRAALEMIARSVAGSANPALRGLRVAWTARQAPSDRQVGTERRAGSAAGARPSPPPWLTSISVSPTLLEGARDRLVAAGVAPRMWTAENRLVLETSTALRVAGRLGRTSRLPQPILHNDLLTELLASERARVGEDLPSLPMLWGVLAAHVMSSADAPWRPPRELVLAFEPGIARLIARQVLTREGRGYRILDPLVQDALHVDAARRWLLLGDVPGLLGACVVNPPDQTRAGWSPWHDELVRALVVSRRVERWQVQLFRAIEVALRGGLLGGAFALCAALARADLLAPARRPSFAATVLGAFAAQTRLDGGLCLLVGGVLAGLVHDCWPLCVRRRDRALQILDALDQSLSDAGCFEAAFLLVPMRDALAGDLPALLARWPADPTDASMDPHPAMKVVLDVMLFDASFPAPADLQELRTLQEAFADAWWVRMDLAGRIGVDPDEAEEARSDALMVAHERLAVARRRKDAESLARWQPRATPPSLPPSVDTRWLQRALFCEAVLQHAGRVIALE
jgi:hypothetical protein